MKRSQLICKTPLRSRAAKPKAVHRERTAQPRMKRRIVSKTALENRHLERVAALPCCVSGARPVEVHHLLKAPQKRCRRDHQWVIPLRPDLHQNWSRISVHGLGTEAKFEAHHGLPEGFLVSVAAREWAKTMELEHA